MSAKTAADDRGFKALLGLGALVSLGLGLAGFLSPEMLESILGLQIVRRGYGVGRMFGALSLAIGIGYVVAAANPTRSRALLAQCFAVPAMLFVTTIVALTRDEIETGQGVVFAIYNAAYCLLYFRMYPRISSSPPASPKTPKPPDQPDSTSRKREP